jgi:hypothetical protein
MSDNSIKTMFYFIIFLLTIYPLIELLVKKNKWYVRLLIGVFLVFFWFIAIKYKNITDKETEVAVSKADSLSTETKRLTNELKVKTDSTNYYLQALKDSIKSMNTTEDKRKTFNNYIDKIETLNQY